MRIEVQGVEPFEIDDNAPEETIKRVVQQLTSEASYVRPHRGETQIGTPQVPEWKQQAMKGVNALPEIGEAIGTAGGMAATALNPGAAMAIPATAALGRLTGRIAQTPLTQLLLPQAGATLPPAPEIASTALKGAQGGMINSAIGAMAPKVLAPGAAEAIKSPDTSWAGKTRDSLTKLLVKPALGNPAEAKQAIRTIGQGQYDIAGSEGPAQIQNRIRALSGEVDDIIANAAESGKKVSTRDLIEPLYDIKDSYTNAGLVREAAAAQRQIRGFETLPTELDPVKAQEIKKLIYSNISENKWGQFSAPPATKVQKSFSSGLAQNLEDISTKDLSKINEELGKLIQARPYATTGAEKAQEAGLTKRWSNSATQTAANLLNKINKELASRPDYVPDRSLIGSPYENLEKMFGISAKGEGD